MTSSRTSDLSPLLQEGDDLLELSLAQLQGRIEEQLEGLSRGLDKALTTPIRQAFQAALTAHEGLMQAAGFSSDPEGDGGSATREWKEIRSYREGLRLEVLTPLRASLQELQVGQEVAQRWEEFKKAFPELSQGLPEEILRTEPGDLYGRRESDRSWVAAGKTLIRFRRGISRAATGAWGSLRGLLGQEVTLTPHPSQRVPLRSLALGCLQSSFPLALDAFSEALHQHFAGPVSLLGSEVSNLTREWFPAEASGSPSEVQAGAEPGAETGGEKEMLPKIAADLHAVLAEGAALGEPKQAMLRIRQALEGEWEQLTEEIRVSGSFQESRRVRKAERRLERLSVSDRARTAQWIEWHPGNLESLHLAIVLLRLREKWDQTQDDLLKRIDGEILSPLTLSWREARDGLSALKAEAGEALSKKGAAGKPPEEVAGEVTHLLERAQLILQEKLLAPGEPKRTSEPVAGIADSVAMKFSESLRILPESISTLPIQEEVGWVQPNLSRREVPLREITLQTMDVLRLEAIRTSFGPILGFLESSRAKCLELPSVILYNLNSARDEILNPAGDPQKSVLEDTKDLVLEGLERTALAIEELLAGVSPAWQDASQASQALLAAGFKEIHARAVVEGSVQEQLLDIRSRFQRGVRRGLELARVRGKEITRVSGHYFRRAFIRVARLVHLGKSVVGVAETQAKEAERALEVLRNIPRLLDPLPLVYKRLFSFQPISDATLLVAREEEVDWLSRRFRLWKEGVGSPTLVTGPAGVGVTSLVNVAVESVFQGAEICRASFPTRIQTKDALARHLAERLGLGEGAGEWDLAGVEAALQARGRSDPPKVVLAEDLEHLVIRTPGGTEILDAFFSLQARTAQAVFWLSTSTGPAWKYFLKTEPLAAGVVGTLALPPLSRDCIQALILTRHKRSGLPLEFLPSRDLNPLVRRRLRLARSEEAQQEILLREFFDRVYKTSDGNVSMAVLLWLRCADFDSREGWLRVQPPRPLRFGLLEDLDLSLDFALMAFLEHGSLSLEEYRLIFGHSREEAYQVFEGLRSRMLLEPSGLNQGLPTYLEAISETGRYQIPPLLDHVVSQRLRDRNILH